ncbi:MAG: hypothetical protein CMJ75_13470 [Planctomycetaceae bacterium]|nr:hypothetical protein [Planctomycetaceae bacterium]
MMPGRLPITRRDALRLMGGVPAAWPAAERVAEGAEDDNKRPPRSVLFVFLAGGPSHIDTFDMKPDAPAEVRGPFQSIATQTAGYRVCEHLPLLAQRTGKYTVVRTLGLKSQADAVHELATPLVLSGTDYRKPGATTVWSRHDWPCYAAALEFVRPRTDGLPSGISLPYRIEPFPGQDAGFLGPLYDPWQLNVDLNNPRFDAQAMRLPDGFSRQRLQRRGALLGRFRGQGGHGRTPGQQQFAKQQQRAYQVLSRGTLAHAFDLEREPQAVRDRYGGHLWGQALLLSRRLIQAGIPIVQANLGHPYYWDTHTENFQGHKERLLPPFDRAFSALLDDMEMSGLLEETLVVAMGEFGRTPKIGGNVGTPTYSPTGRDHWVFCFSGLFAGAGVRPGQVIGRTDNTASYPITDTYFASDVGATIFANLGIDLDSVVHDRLGRGYPLNEGQVMQTLYDASRS